ncbi:MAG: hypothetical protein SNJ74_06000 [Fimbriimonadaceae bacterium]
MQEVELREEVRQLREEVAQLRKLVEAMAQGAHAAADLTAAATAGKEPSRSAVGVSEEVLAIIAASVSAFLGNKARVRHVRPVSSGLDSWRVQGRLAIQGSHNVRS